MLRSHAKILKPYRSSVEFDDDLMHFLQDCWHLKDWIGNDQALRIGRPAIETEVASHKSLRVVADLANGSKHIDNSRYCREGANVTSKSVTVHLCSTLPADISHTITLGDSSTIFATDLTRQAIESWDIVLRKLGLIS